MVESIKRETRLGLRAEVIGAGLSLFLSIYVFYIVDPLAVGMVFVEKLLKIWVYALTLISFNLWLRVDMRLKRWDINGPKAVKAHIKLTSFFFFMLALMDLPLIIASLGGSGPA